MRSVKLPRLMFALTIDILDPDPLRGLRERRRASRMNLSPWQTKKAPYLEGAADDCARGCVLALTGKASDAVHMITSGIAALRSTGATDLVPFVLAYLARAYAELASSMTLGAALMKR